MHCSTILGTRSCKSNGMIARNNGMLGVTSLVMSSWYMRPTFPLPVAPCPACCVESGKKYVNCSNKSLCDLNNCATSSYTCEIDFKFFLYMFKISKNVLYTLSSLAKRVLILFTYEIAWTNSTCGFCPCACRFASSRSSLSISSTRISCPRGKN